MVFPLSTNPKDVNVALMQAANENRADIDAIHAEVKSMKAQEAQIMERYTEQQDRWTKYYDAWQNTLLVFHLSAGTMTINEMIETFDWSKLD